MKADYRELTGPETKVLAALVRRHDKFTPERELMEATGLAASTISLAIKQLRFAYGPSAIESRKKHGYRVHEKVWESFNATGLPR